MKRRERERHVRFHACSAQPKDLFEITEREPTKMLQTAEAHFQLTTEKNQNHLINFDTITAVFLNEFQ